MVQKVIIFGGSGFIGSYVAEELKNRGYDITIADIRKPNNDMNYIYCDVTKPIDITIPKDSIVYNFAGIANIEEDTPNEMIKTHVMGTINILNKCKDVYRFIYASSVYVFSRYGSFYRIAKQTCEDIIEEYHKKYGIRYTILRYGTLYGPKCQEWNGVNQIVKQAITGKVIFEGTSDEIREFIHIRDASKLSVDILDDRYENQRINITGVEKLKWDDFIKLTFEIIGKEPNINYIKPDKKNHYTITPYSHRTIHSEKIIPTEYTDLGQGILEMLYENNYIFEEESDHGKVMEEETNRFIDSENNSNITIIRKDDVKDEIQSGHRLINTASCSVMRITQNKGEGNKKHFHIDWDEVWIVDRGKWLIETTEGKYIVEEGDIAMVKRGVLHKITALEDNSVRLAISRSDIKHIYP